MAFTGKFVVTGPPGSGRSSVVDHLADLGYWSAPDVVPEVRKSVKSQQSTVFDQVVIQRRRDLYNSAPEDRACFFDCGIPDTIANARLNGHLDVSEYEVTARMHRYSNPVFFLPYWKGIHRNNSIDDEFWLRVRAMERQLFEVYQELGYTIFTLPRDSIEERVGLILSIIGGQKDND